MNSQRPSFESDIPPVGYEEDHNIPETKAEKAAKAAKEREAQNEANEALSQTLRTAEVTDEQNSILYPNGQQMAAKLSSNLSRAGERERALQLTNALKVVDLIESWNEAPDSRSALNALVSQAMLDSALNCPDISQDIKDVMEKLIKRYQKEGLSLEPEGLLSETGPSVLDASFGDRLNLSDERGDVIGAKGIQVGPGGLGSRNSGLGGGGSVDGLGELEIKAPKSTVPKSPENMSGYMSMVDSVVKRNMQKIKYPYERRLQNNPNLGGPITVEFTVGLDGKVTSVEAKAGNVLSNIRGEMQEIADDVAKAFESFEFPNPTGGKVVKVTRTFNFDVR